MGSRPAFLGAVCHFFTGGSLPGGAGGLNRANSELRLTQHGERLCDSFCTRKGNRPFQQGFQERPRGHDQHNSNSRSPRSAIAENRLLVPAPTPVTVADPLKTTVSPSTLAAVIGPCRTFPPHPPLGERFQQSSRIPSYSAKWNMVAFGSPGSTGAK